MMTCPYCGKEMRKGFLQAARCVFWGEKKHKLSFLPSREDVEVAQGTVNGAFAEAYFCDSCGKVIVDISKKTD